MPILRPFRALRFDVSRTDLSDVLCPPYDIISPADRRELLDRHPHNAVRIELPADLGAATDADYRDAARTVAAWRTDGVLRKDREPTITLHRMRWRNADGSERQATGVFSRLRLEPFGPGGGVLPHERTLGGPKEDRYALLKATGLNASPIVLLAGASEPSIASRIDALTARPPDASASIGGVDQDVWVVPTSDRGRDQSAERRDDDLARIDPDLLDAASLLACLGAAPVTIADGHHRYETALGYREERGRVRACESDPAWDYVMTLVYPTGGSPPALPTHRVLEDGPAGEALVGVLGDLGKVEPLDGPDDLLARMGQPPTLGPDDAGSGRIGLMSGTVAAILRVRPEAVAAHLGKGTSEAFRGLDVNALGLAIEAAWGLDGGSLASEGRLRYVKDARAAVASVTSGEAATCFLLDAVPAAAIARVARAGEVMPQKSTYFHPKAPTGLLFSPMEW